MADYNAMRYSRAIPGTNPAHWSLPDSDPKMRHGFIFSNQAAEADRRRGPLPSRTAARLVRPPSPPVAVAAVTGRTGRSLSGLAVGNHAAADRRQNRGAVFREVSGALARHRCIGPRLAR